MKTETFDVRIGHFVPDAPPVDFLVDGHPVLTDRSFGDVPDYTKHRAAEYEVSVRRTDDESSILEDAIGFEPGAFHTLLFVGTLDDPEFRLLTDGQRDVEDLQ